MLACGSNQFVPKHFIKDYSIPSTTQVLTSDFILKDQGYQKLVQLIKARRGKCKISILGGSHSAFSVLYLLLHGPVKIGIFEDYARRTLLKQVKNKNNKATKTPQGAELAVC